MQLLTAAGNGDGTAVDNRQLNRRDSSFFTLFVWGTFGGSTVKLQISPDGTNWFDVSGADAITAAGALNVEFRAKQVRGSVSGGTANSINMRLF